MRRSIFGLSGSYTKKKCTFFLIPHQGRRETDNVQGTVPKKSSEIIKRAKCCRAPPKPAPKPEIKAFIYVEGTAGSSYGWKRVVWQTN